MYLMIKGSIQEETITLINIYTPTTGTPKYIKQILTDIKGETDNSTIIVRVFNIPVHQWTDHPGRKSVRKQWS